MIRHSWSRTLSFALAMIPVGMLVLVVGSAFVQSMRALVDVGLGGLFGPVLASTFLVGPGKEKFGLIGPIWGTLLVAMVAIALALPASIALAVLVTELPHGKLRAILDGVLSTLAGIPPVAYALMGVFFTESVMQPKFAGSAIPSEEVKATILGWDRFNQLLLPIGIPNSTLLGGMLIGLLIQPFMTPLIQDALRGVPQDLREASYALGAGRWYTLTRIVFPYSLRGIISAATIGSLKAIGDVTIAYFVIGTVTILVRVPTPLIDVFSQTPPLSAAGAGLMGGIGGEAEGVRAVSLSVANFAGFLLLLLAFGVMGASTLVERTLRRWYPS